MQVKQGLILSACNDVCYRLFVCKMKKLKIKGVIQALFVQVELLLQTNRMVLYERFFLAISGK